MSPFSSLRTRWNAGCALLYVSVFSLGFVFELFGWRKELVHDLGLLKLSPMTVTGLEIAAVALWGPFFLAVLIGMPSQGRRWIRSACSFWWKGVKVALTFLLAALPYLVARGALKYLTVRGVMEHRTENLFLLLLVAAAVTAFPFWGWMLWQRLSRTAGGRKLTEPIRQAGFDPAD